MHELMRNIREKASDFHNRSEGLEALQIVMILAIAAVCLVFVKAFWTPLSQWFVALIEIFLAN